MKSIRKGLLLLLFFYMTFTFTFEVLDKIQRVSIYLGSITIIIFNWRFLKNKIQIKSRYLVISFVCYIWTLLVSFSVPIIYKTFDFSYFSYVLLATKLGVKNIALLIIFLKVNKKKSSFYLYAKYYIMSCCIYVCITIIMILIPSFKEFWVSIIHISSYTRMLTSKPEYISRVGIDGFAGFTQTFMFSFGVILNVYMIILNNSKFKKNRLTIYVSLLLLVIGTLFYGRIGSLISLLALSILLIYYLLKIRNIKRAIGIIIMMLVSFLIITNIAKHNEKVNNWVSWSFDYINNYKNTGNLSNDSVNQMFDMYFVPEIKTVLIGDGYYTDPQSGAFYKSTDIGFLRNFLFFGIFSTIIGYQVIIQILFGIKKCFKRDKNKYGFILFVLFFIQLVLFEMKGGIHYVMYANLLPFYLLLLYNNKEILKKR